MQNRVNYYRTETATLTSVKAEVKDKSVQCTLYSGFVEAESCSRGAGARGHRSCICRRRAPPSRRRAARGPR